MMICIVHNPQTGQSQAMWEGGPSGGTDAMADADAAKQVMMAIVATIEQQQAQQNNGQVKRPSGLIIPPTIVPGDINEPPK